MKKYLFLQFKRSAKLFPFVLSVTLVLFIGLAAVLGMIVSSNAEKEENKVFNIALTGDTDNDYLQLGITALSALDETRFSIAFLEMDEAVAEKALVKGEISAYVVLPDNFIVKALSGEVEPIKYVTTSGDRGIITLFKNEITKLVTDMVVASEKGTYGLADAITENDDGYYDVNRQMTSLSIKYVDLILHRDDMLSVEELGISDGLTTTQYYICGIFIFFVMLIGLPFATIYVKDNSSLSRFLVSKGYSVLVQQLCEYIAHLVSLASLLSVICVFLGATGEFFGEKIGMSFSFNMLASFAIYAFPTVVMIAAFNFMIFEASSNIVGGVLLHFFSVIGLCYISGCFYPIYSFPSIIQKISSVLPVGLAREQLASFFLGKDTAFGVVPVLIYAVVFLAVALLLRSFKTVKGKGGFRNEKMS